MFYKALNYTIKLDYPDGTSAKIYCYSSILHTKLINKLFMKSLNRRLIIGTSGNDDWG